MLILCQGPNGESVKETRGYRVTLTQSTDPNIFNAHYTYPSGLRPNGVSTWHQDSVRGFLAQGRWMYAPEFSRIMLPQGV